METDNKKMVGTLFTEEPRPLSFQERAKLAAEILSKQPPVSYEEAKKQVAELKAVISK